MARLLVLWMLSEKPMHGYRIKKALADEGMRFWFGLEDASIYSVLRTLTKRGYAREQATETEGNRPERTLYAITAEGRRYYRALLEAALDQPTLPIGPIDVALCARGDLSPTTVAEALARRATALDELEHSLGLHSRAAPSKAIVDRNVAIVRAERAWLDQLDNTAIT